MAALWFLPEGSDRLWGAVRESLSLANWYTGEHVLLWIMNAAAGEKASGR